MIGLSSEYDLVLSLSLRLKLDGNSIGSCFSAHNHMLYVLVSASHSLYMHGLLALALTGVTRLSGCKDHGNAHCGVDG